jgi:lactoylglutathione lyase
MKEEERMNFCWVTINVANMEKSLNFYRDVVGLSVDRSMKPSANMEIAFLGKGETKVELIFDAKSDKRNYGDDISLGFEVESVDKTMESLKKRNIKIHSGPHQPNPMIKFFYVLDPDGLKVQFVENIAK